MTRQDWLLAVVIAVGVAALTAGMIAPPICWADDTAPVTVPALPSANLAIPAIQGQVVASATPAPGQPVRVTLAVTVPAGSEVTEVPVSVTMQSTTMSLMSRVLPEPKGVAQATATVTIGADGKGAAVVSLPLAWGTPPAETAAPRIDQIVTSYQMRLSSPLGGGAAPSNLLMQQAQ